MTKGKQHYVPQSYLKNFASKSKNQIFAFDKKTLESFPSNIKNMSAEKYFYDFPTEVVREEYREFFDDFLTKVDGKTPLLLKYLIDLELSQSKFIKQNNKKIKINKKEWSEFLIVQYLRTLKSRNSLVEIQSKFFNLLNKTKNTLESNVLQLLQLTNLAQLEQTQKQYQFDLLYASVYLLPSFLVKHQWEVGLNKTETLLYTSDNPVATIPDSKTIYDLEEIEILFPINSELILILKSGKNTQKKKKACRIVSLDTKKVLDYNKAQIFSSNKHIFCKEEQFEFAKEVCKQQEYSCSKLNNLVTIKKQKDFSS